MSISVQKKKFSTATVVIGVLLLGAAAGYLMVATKPNTKRVKPPMSSPLVTTYEAKRSTAALKVEALGTVKADQETQVRMRVSGQVEELGSNFDVGGLVQKGDLLLRIDAHDYENALALKKSALAKAQADYDLEMGQQRVARTEVAQLNKTASGVRNTSLALRAPQLAQAKATLQSAEVEVKQAELDLSRTQVNAPYNALVTARNTSLGSQASPSDTVATLVSTDDFYIEAAIPLDKLQKLGMGIFDNTEAEVYTTVGGIRQGRVRHSIASLDETTRMGRVLVEVEDPLALHSDKPTLLLGDHVRVELQAGTLQNVIELPRVALRGNDTVWVAKKNDDGSSSLDIRTVNVLWKDLEVALVDKGLETGDRIVISPLGAPIQDMSVRLEGEVASKAAGSGAEGAKGAKGGSGTRGANGAKGPQAGAEKGAGSEKGAGAEGARKGPRGGNGQNKPAAE